MVYQLYISEAVTKKSEWEKNLIPFQINMKDQLRIIYF